MKKIRFGIASSALVLAIGALPVALSHAHPIPVRAETQVDGGSQCLCLNEVDHGSSEGMYVLANASDTLPYNGDWSVSYKPVASSGALVVDGVDRTAWGPLLKKLGNDRFYLDTAGAVADGATITVSGDWHYSDGANDYVFTVEPALSLTYVGGDRPMGLCP